MLLIILSAQDCAADTLTGSMGISAAGMELQNQRLKIIAENIANSNVPAEDPEKDPYRRKLPLVEHQYQKDIDAEVPVAGKIIMDQSPFIEKYEPYHPAANEKGIVKYSNVNIIEAHADAKEAQRSFEANLHAFEISKTNQSRIIESMR